MSTACSQKEPNATQDGEGRTLRAEEFAGDVKSLAADNDYLLAVEQLFCDSASQATEQVSLAVDDNLSDRKLAHAPIIDVTVLLENLRLARSWTSYYLPGDWRG